MVRLVSKIRLGNKDKPCVLELWLCTKPFDVRSKKLVYGIGALAAEGVHANDDDAIVLDYERNKAHLAISAAVGVTGDKYEQGCLAERIARPVKERIDKLLTEDRLHVFGDDPHAFALEELGLVAVNCLYHVKLGKRFPWRDLIGHVRASLRVFAGLACGADKRYFERVE